jgi:two-component system phosphate regulon sensor histidine kinase PhoR
MKKRPFFFHILASLLLLCAFSCTVLLLYATREFKRFYIEQSASELKQRAIFFEQIVRPFAPAPHAVDSLAKLIGVETDTRFTIILPRGAVIGDTRENPSSMDNHNNRPEVIRALAGDTGVAVRFSVTLSRDLIYVALPVMSADTLSYIVRASIPLHSLAQHMEAFYRKLARAVAIIILVSIGIGIWLSRRLSGPLVRLKRLSDNFARGDFTAQPAFHDSITETFDLALSMEAMARQLDERITTITQQKNVLDTILSAMAEGVVAVDTDEHIIMINKTAGAMLGIDAQTARGKWVQEAVRNTAFRHFVTRLLQERSALYDEIRAAANGDTEKTIELHGTTLAGADGAAQGVLFVMHDVTHLKRLEGIRRDFVANVSHELRTPLTAIKGFVETLLDGAKNNPPELDRFLAIIGNHVDRLNNLIGDLLTISRLEKDDSGAGLDREDAALCPVVHSAVEVCREKAQRKNITVSTACDETIIAAINASLLEQAIINLVDNAINYSPADTAVHIAVSADASAVRLAVSDQGQGISPEHLPRIFERFYRVDKARSRKMGGTGLGLSIVKHIVHAHNGSVTAASEPGRGSTFTITIPRALPPPP